MTEQLTFALRKAWSCHACGWDENDSGPEEVCCGTAMPTYFHPRPAEVTAAVAAAASEEVASYLIALHQRMDGLERELQRTRRQREGAARLWRQVREAGYLRRSFLRFAGINQRQTASLDRFFE